MMSQPSTQSSALKNYGRYPRKLARHRAMDQSFLEEDSVWPPPDINAVPHLEVLDDARPPRASGARGEVLDDAYGATRWFFGLIGYLLQLILSELLKNFIMAILAAVLTWNYGPLFQGTTTGLTNATNHDLLITRIASLEHAILFNLPGGSPWIHDAHVGSSNDSVPLNFASLDAGAHYMPEITSMGHHARLGFPNLALTPSLEPGNCWLLPRATGHLGVRLSSKAILTHITLNHPSPHALPEPRNAPRNVVLWGLVEEEYNLKQFNSDPNVRGLSYTQPPPNFVKAQKDASPHGVFIELGHFQYQYPRWSSNGQAFSVHEDVIKAGIKFGIVLLEVRGNWGADDTCLYNFRIYGRDVQLDV